MKQKSACVPQPLIREHRLGSDLRGDAGSGRGDPREKICTPSLEERPVPLLTVDLERREGLGGMQVVVDFQRRRRISVSLRTELRPGVGRAVLAQVVLSQRDEARKPLSVQLWQGGAAVSGYLRYRDVLDATMVPDPAAFRSHIRDGERGASC